MTPDAVPAAAARSLILVKHAPPLIDPAVPAQRWLLSDEGRRRCAALADLLASYAPVAIAASMEPKAAETARLAGERLAVPVEALDGLHEHDRSNVGFLSDADFDAAVAAFFARPDELVLGKETANEALARFSAAVAVALARWPAGNLVIVAHGTVISMYVAAAAGLDARALWKRLGLPSFVVMGLPGGNVTAEVDSLTK